MIYRRLTEQALQTQAPLRAWLDANHIRYTPFYLVNMIEVEGDQQVAEALRAFAEVNRLEANPQVDNQLEVKNSRSWLQELRFPSLESSTELSAASPQSAPAATLPYGLSFTHADRGNGLSRAGNRRRQPGHGRNDQPARPAIVALFQPPHRPDTANWFDAIDGPPTAVSATQPPPVDVTRHTIGTMLGDATSGDTFWHGNLRHSGLPAAHGTALARLLATQPAFNLSRPYQGGDKFSGHPELAPQVINSGAAHP